MEVSFLGSLGSLSPAPRVATLHGGHGAHAHCLFSARRKGPDFLAGPSRSLLEQRSRPAATQATPKKDGPTGLASLALEMEDKESAASIDLLHFICQGPLLKQLGASAGNVAERIEEWRALGTYLSRHLGFDELRLSEAERMRIYHYYVPVFLWCKKQLELHRSRWQKSGPSPPLVIGISAPQGCGKTTIVDSLEQLFNASGSSAATISIDDFYLTATQQTKLSEEYKGNKLLEVGVSASDEASDWSSAKCTGSHDLQLGSETLKALLNLRNTGTKAKCPRYEKSARNGRGDRADPSTWPEMEGPLAVVLFEGWMLGFEPLDEATVVAVDPQLDVVNQHLRAYHEAWHSYIDSWIIVQVPEPSWIFKWRLEAEVAMRSGGKPGMTDDEVEDFVSRYMPAYKAYLPALYSLGPKGAIPEQTFKFEIDRERNPVG